MKFIKNCSRLCCAAAAAVALFTGTNAAQAAGYNLRVYSSSPANEQSGHYVWYRRFDQNLKEALGDTFRLNYFPNGMLGKEADACQQVKMGAIQLMISGTSIWATLAPEIGVLDIGFLFNSFDHEGRALDGKAGQMLGKILEEKANIKILGFGYNLGARNVYTKKQVTSPQDLNGVKVRVLPVPTFLATLEAMGAVPIPMATGEIYSGLQMGVIEGVEHDAPTVLAGKYYEQVKYAWLTQHVFNPIVAVMNKDLFDRMPKEVQVAVMEAARDATAYERSQALEAENKAIARLQELGVTFTQCDRSVFKAPTQKVRDDFVQEYPATAEIVEYIESLE